MKILHSSRTKDYELLLSIEETTRGLNPSISHHFIKLDIVRHGMLNFTHEEMKLRRRQAPKGFTQQRKINILQQSSFSQVTTQSNTGSLLS